MFFSKILFLGAKNDKMHQYVRNLYYHKQYYKLIQENHFKNLVDCSIGNANFDHDVIIINILNPRTVFLERFINDNTELDDDYINDDQSNSNLDTTTNLRIQDKIKVIRLFFNIDCFLIETVKFFEALEKFNICKIVNFPEFLMKFRSMVMKQVNNTTKDNVFLITGMNTKEMIEIKRRFIVWQIYAAKFIKEKIFNIEIKGEKEIIDMLL